MPVSVIILAAGQGKRMHSALPKVLQPMAGKPILRYVVDTARALDPASLHIVFGHGGDAVREAFGDDDLHWAMQAEQLGTGHAVQQALPQIPDGQTLLILCGDVPLLTPEALRPLVAAAERGSLAVLSARLDDATGYGRMLRNAGGKLTGIVEQRDASDEQLEIDEINTGVMAGPAALFNDYLGKINSDNAQGEYYLTDVVAMAANDGKPVEAVCTDDAAAALGINNRHQLAEAEAVYRARKANELLGDGVTLADPARIDVRGTLKCGRDVFIDVNVVFAGDVLLGDNVTIGANSIVTDAQIGAGTVVHPMSIIEDSRIGERCEIGPYARVRPGVELAERAKLGNFVELKKATVGPGSKVNHLTYVGDAEIGANVNVGAGTITCNYDGANKHLTVIGDDAFIGSGVELVAPIEVGAGATIGAGSTVSKSAPAGELTVERAKQVTISGWRRPVKP